MGFVLFTQPCKTCGEMNLGPREGGKARGRWLGYDDCLKCRQAAYDAEQAEKCDLGVGCDEAGTCYAAASGQPANCPRVAHRDPPITEKSASQTHEEGNPYVS